VRIRTQQGALFSDGNSVKHVGVVSSLWDMDAAKLVPWHRQQADHIEALHDETDTSWRRAVRPSRYFGANAAWFLLVLLTHDVPVTMKRMALPPELLDARPMCLRGAVLRQAARVLHHSRRPILRLSTRLRHAIARLMQDTAILGASGRYSRASKIFSPLRRKLYGRIGGQNRDYPKTGREG
jgi:hypothetical protein